MASAYPQINMINSISFSAGFGSRKSHSEKNMQTEEQTIVALKDHEADAKVDDLCRKKGVSFGTFYN